jgi:hypothetical protein
MLLINYIHIMSQTVKMGEMFIYLIQEWELWIDTKIYFSIDLLN